MLPSADTCSSALEVWVRVLFEQKIPEAFRVGSAIFLYGSNFHKELVKRKLFFDRKRRQILHLGPCSFD